MWLMKDSLNPEGEPLRAPEAIADTIPGFTALIGILATLFYRSKTGRGQRIDMAQMDAMIAVSQSFAFWTIAGTTFNRASLARGVGGHGLYKAKDVSDTKGDVTTPSQLLGQHNEEVLTRILSYSNEQLEILKKEGVI